MIFSGGESAPKAQFPPLAAADANETEAAARNCRRPT
jgi:hypothetical protein